MIIRKQLYRFYNNKKLFGISFVVLLMLIIVLPRYFLFDSVRNRRLMGDDILYVNVADNLREGDGLTSDILMYRQILTYGPPYGAPYRYEEWDDVSHPIHNVGPIQPLFLAAVYGITSAHPPSWYFVAVVANTIVTMLVIVTFYLFARRLFNRDTACMATIAAAMLTSVFWYSMEAAPFPLLLLFIMLTFNVATRASTAKGWIAVGALAALAHLTHPLALLLILSLILWRWSEKRFKDSMLLVASYLAVMMPWMVWNQISFGDFTLGTGIPLYSILGLFGINAGSVETATTFSTYSGYLNSLWFIPAELMRTYHTVYLLPLLLFSVFGFIRYRAKKILVPQFIFFVLSLISYVGIAFSTFRVAVETRYLVPAFLLLLPLSIYGFIRFASIIFNQVKIHSHATVAYLACASIVLPLLIAMPASLSTMTKDLNTQYESHAETAEFVHFHEWLREQNAPEEAVVLTNDPYTTYLASGLKSLHVQTEEADLELLTWLVDRYDAYYIVVYWFPTHPETARQAFLQLGDGTNAVEIYSSANIRCYGFIH